MIIFSVFNSYNDDATNLKQHKDVKKYLTSKRIPFIEYQGCYKNIKELSIMINDSNREQVEFLFDLYNQESILHLDFDWNAKLLYNDGRVEPLGVWQRVPKHVAEQHDAYSIDLDTNETFIAA